MVADVQLNVEDVQDGMELPSFAQGPVQTPDIVRFSAAVENFEQLHHDYRWCVEHGFPDVLINGPIKHHAYTMFTNWIGEGGFLKKLECQYRDMDVPGNTLTARGRVTKKYDKDDLGYVECEVWVENQKGDITCPGTATAILPRSKGPALPIEFPVPSEYQR